MTYEGLRLKIQKIRRKGFAPLRRRELDAEDFTIISNNCWGGMIYESYGLPKGSPTAGLFFMAPDYIRFLSALDRCLRSELTFIRPEHSRWITAPEVSADPRFGTYPIGQLSAGGESIEIFFLHCRSEAEAHEKWTRRCQRVHHDKLLVKFNDQNGCSEEDIRAFASLPFKNKVFFTCRHWPGEKEFARNMSAYCIVRQFPPSKSIRASFEPFGRSRKLDVTGLINSL